MTSLCSKKCCQHLKILNGYSPDVWHQKRCRWLASRLIAAITIWSAVTPVATVADETHRTESKTVGDKAGDRLVMALRGIVVPFRWCPPGTFMMGLPTKEVIEIGKDVESGRPIFAKTGQVKVTLTRGFWMQETEVTQELWAKVMGASILDQKALAKGRDLYGVGRKHPIYFVSHDEAVDFCRQLTETQGLPNEFQFMLPTEAQWEYACRAGTTTRFAFGDDARRLDDFVWHYENSTAATVRDPSDQKYITGCSQPVTRLKPNAWGIFDMDGNVREWTNDWYSDTLVGSTDPLGPANGTSKVRKGGSWSCHGDQDLKDFLCGRRGSDSPSYRGFFQGFRTCIVVKATKSRTTE